MHPIEVYSPEHCRNVLDQVRSNPRGFIRRCKENPNIKLWEVYRSLKAWGIES